MAIQNRNIIRDGYVVWIDTDTSTLLELDNYSGSTEMRATALSQTYDVSQGGTPQQITELADTDALYEDSEIVSINTTISFDSLLTQSGGTLNYAFDDTKKVEGFKLKVGDKLWLAIGKYNNGVISKNDILCWCKCVVESKNYTGNVNDFHTYSLSVAVKGELKEEPLP